ncbi:MAG TPA: ABC transporter substrate-binding protein, partial [Anaerolineales bacterium]|nr:ABC transporter substrate-binding protein [Anaerolineales bacterium]
MKHNFKFAFLGCLVVISLVLSACGAGTTTQAPSGATDAPAAPAGETIKVGALYPLTGDLAKLGEENKDGLQLAIDEINAAGGIASMGGAKIELVWADSQ